MRVLCNAEDCIFWGKLEESEQISRHGGRPHDWDKYNGECIREIVGIKYVEITTPNVIFKNPKCETFSDKWPDGHMDFSRYPQGGHF